MSEELSAAIEALYADFGLDPEALRARYRAERDRRLRPDGIGQFVQTTGRYEHCRDDPWADPHYSRATAMDQVDVLVIGGGLGGLLAGANLRKAGIDRLAVSQEAFQRECTPSYFNSEGDLKRFNKRNSVYGG